MIPAALSAFTSFSARSGTSVKPDSGAFSVSSPRAFATNTAASTRLIGSWVPNVPSLFPLILLKLGNQQHLDIFLQHQKM